MAESEKVRKAKVAKYPAEEQCAVRERFKKQREAKERSTKRKQLTSSANGYVGSESLKGPRPPSFLYPTPASWAAVCSSATNSPKSRPSGNGYGESETMEGQLTPSFLYPTPASWAAACSSATNSPAASPHSCRAKEIHISKKRAVGMVQDGGNSLADGGDDRVTARGQCWCERQDGCVAQGVKGQDSLRGDEHEASLGDGVDTFIGQTERKKNKGERKPAGYRCA